MKTNRFGIVVVVTFSIATSFARSQQIDQAGAGTQQVDPAIIDLPISASAVTDVHLHPFFTTTIRLPDAVKSVAVGIPTLFKVEHSADSPQLVFIKPTTAAIAISNLIIALQSGQEISLRLLSDGANSRTPVDFVVHYEPRQSFLIGSTDEVAGSSPTDPDPTAKPSAIDLALKLQSQVAGRGHRRARPSEPEGARRIDGGNPLGIVGAMLVCG